MILKSNANIICLQECTKNFLDKLQSSPELMQKYKYFGFQDFKTFYGIAIISEWPPANIYEYTYQNISPKALNKSRSPDTNKSTVNSTNISKSRTYSPQYRQSCVVQQAPAFREDMQHDQSEVVKSNLSKSKNGQAHPKDLLLAKSEMCRAVLIAEYFIQVRHKLKEGQEVDELNLSMVDGAYYIDKLYPFYVATSHFESLNMP